MSGSKLVYGKIGVQNFRAAGLSDLDSDLIGCSSSISSSLFAGIVLKSCVNILVMFSSMHQRFSCQQPIYIEMYICI